MSYDRMIFEFWKPTRSFFTLDPSREIKTQEYYVNQMISYGNVLDQRPH